MSRNHRKFVSGWLALGLILSASTAWPATFYVSTTGSDSNSGGSSAPWKTFAKAWTALQAGDTLIVKDGTYTEALVPTKSGTSGNPITVKAENDGMAVLNQVTIGSLSDVKSYLTIEGFTVIGTAEGTAFEIQSPDGTALSSQTNNIIVRRVGVKGSCNLDNCSASAVGRASDILLEDVWAWGKGRYTLLVYGGTRVTVRRGVFRWDGWAGTNYKPDDPKFGLGVYDTHDSIIENVLLIDGASTSAGGDTGAMYVPGNDNGNTAPYTDSDNNKFLGMILLNNVEGGQGMEGGSGGDNDNNLFENIVVWGNSDGISVNKNANNTLFNHVTVGRSTGDGSWFGSSGVTGSVVQNSLIYDNAGTGINGTVTSTFNNVFSNGDNYSGSTPATDISQDPNLLYITRLEAASAGKGTASDGGDRGATVTKQYVGGVLQATDLWPWPSEDRIKTEMCSGVTTNWCGTGKTLTTYIWEYLGNAIPPEVYTDLEAPTGTVLINSGSSFTNATAVTLTLSATDNKSGVSQMQFSNDGITWTTLESYATTKSWTLTSGDGAKTVSVRFKDGDGNFSNPFTDTITLDTVSPAQPSGVKAN